MKRNNFSNGFNKKHPWLESTKDKDADEKIKELVKFMARISAEKDYNRKVKPKLKSPEK